MIRVRDLQVVAGTFRLSVDQLAMHPREYVAVLGPNGSGKTMLLETIAGLRRASAGSVEFQDDGAWIDVTSWLPEDRRVGFVYQDHLLFPHMSVRDNVAFGVAREMPRAQRAAVVEEVADLVKIRHLLHLSPTVLSGGERQRVAIARALARRPVILLLDEPFSAVDEPSAAALRLEVKRVCAELGVTVLHVTHDLEEAVAVGDRLAVLSRGELLQMGEVQNVLQHPVGAEVARLVGCINCVAGHARDHRITLEGGLMVDAARAPDGPVTVWVRPEHVRISAPPGASAVPNMFAARVESATRGAATWTVSLRPLLASGDECVWTFRATMMDGDVEANDIAPGACIWAYVHPERLHALSATNAGRDA